jgi:hypothetical protein
MQRKLMLVLMVMLVLMMMLVLVLYLWWHQGLMGLMCPLLLFS